MVHLKISLTLQQHYIIISCTGYNMCTLSLCPVLIELVVHLGSVIYAVEEHQGAHDSLVCQAGNLEYPMSVRSGSRSHNGPQHELHWRLEHHTEPVPG